MTLIFNTLLEVQATYASAGSSSITHTKKPKYPRDQ